MRTSLKSTAPVLLDDDRRSVVLQSALETFARYGYRRTSMEQVARDADISRPGLYFLFASKPALFRDAVELSLNRDLAAAEQALTGSGDPLRARLRAAFDLWAGHYVGPLTRDISGVIDDNPDLLGPLAQRAPQRFRRLIVDALRTQQDRRAAERVADTLISASIGIKHQVDDRQDYRRRLGVAVDLLVAPDHVGAS